MTNKLSDETALACDSTECMNKKCFSCQLPYALPNRILTKNGKTKCIHVVEEKAKAELEGSGAV